MIGLLLYGATKIYPDETAEVKAEITQGYKDTGGQFYHENEDSVDDAIEVGMLAAMAGVFVVAVVLVPFTGGASAAVGITALGALETVDTGITAATISAKVIDSQISWTNDDNTPAYVIDLDGIKEELKLINDSDSLDSLAIILESSEGELDITNEESLNELATQLAPIEHATGLNLDEIIQETNRTSESMAQLTFIHRKEREIRKRNAIIFNGLMELYRNSSYRNQQIIITNYIFKKQDPLNDSRLINKTFDEIYAGGTFQIVSEYTRCFLKNKGQMKKECFSDPYMRAFIQHGRPQYFNPQSPFNRLIATVFGIDMVDLTDDTASYYKLIVSIVIMGILLLGIFLIIGNSLYGIYTGEDIPSLAEGHENLFEGDR